jgi:hypothetical protein
LIAQRGTCNNKDPLPKNPTFYNHVDLQAINKMAVQAGRDPSSPFFCNLLELSDYTGEVFDTKYLHQQMDRN